MTTFVYTEEVMSSTSGNPPGNPASVTRFLVEVGTTAGMGDTQSGAARALSSSSSSNTPPVSSGHRRTGSPKPATAKGRFSVKQKGGGGSGRMAGYPSGYPSSFNPHVFTIVAYLPNDGGKRLKLHCTPGQTVQQVIESEMPEISHSGYQVYQFPSRALLNPEKEASVLQDQEISIEPMRHSSPVNDMGDERLMVVKELLRTEDTYLENLRNIFDIYMEPLKKWGLPQSEMNTMFRSLSRLCDLLMNFFSELEMAVRDWNTRSTPIGGLFKQYCSFWDLYKEYSLNYAKACKLLKDKRASDESFNKFLELKRGAAMHTLESLMLLPVQRIDEYHKLLVRLSQLTPRDHPDCYDLQYTVTLVESIVQAREQQLNQSANELKLNLVQQRFPNDNLNLDQSIEVIEQQSKRYKGYASSASRHPRPRKSGSFGPSSMDQTDSSPMERRRRGIRIYVNEGPVKIITLGMQSHDRHLFLFNDMLIIAKPLGKQSSKTPQKVFKRKDQLRLSEMWVSESVSDITECSLPSDTTFVLGWPGWPITNCVAAFSSPEERKLWFTLLSKYIAAQRQTLQPERVSMQIVNLTKSSNNIPIWMQVHVNETTNDVLSRALDQLAIAVAKSNCQMWVKFSREGAGLQLLGHEHPFAIQNFHNRHQIDYLGDGKPVQLQMVIKRKTTNPPLKKNRSTFIRWRPKPKSKDSFKGVFKAPLHMVITNDQLPEILQEILARLYAEGPHTFGIFRQSANHKKVKEYKEAIDNRATVDLTDEGIHVLGALLKDFLRSVPGGILMSSRYTEFVATNDVSDISARVQHIQRVINRLPKENQLFLQYLMPLLYRISRYEEVNCMNSINLAICFAPSLLWPDSGLDVIKNEVPPLVQFMVEHCPKIFGEDLPDLYKQLDLPVSPGEEQMEYVSEKSPAKQLVPTKREDGDRVGHKRADSMDSSMSEGSAGEDMEESNLLRTRGLTYSDSQLSQISQLDEYDRQPPRAREFVGERRVAHKHPRQGFGVSHHLRQEFDKPQAKRIKKLTSKKPERSSSLHGTNDSPYSASARLKYRKSRERVEPSAVRRKSIATQTTLPRKTEQFVQQLAPIPQSSSSSLTSSSQGGYSPQIHSRTATLGEHGAGFSSPQHQPGIYRSYVRHEEASPRHMVVEKKRRVPQYSHSFSNRTENKPNKPLQTSNSFYDRLLPLEASVGSRAQFVIADDEQNKPMWRIGDVSQGQGTRQLGTPMASSLATHSNQSLASSKSGSSNGSQGMQGMHYLSRPSNVSLASSGSGGRGSPGTGSMEGGPFRKPDRGHVKDMITSRFNIPPDYTPPSSSSSSMTASTTQSKPMTRRLGGGYPQHEPMQLQEQAVYPNKSDDRGDSLERVRQKMNERKRLDSGNNDMPSDPSFIKSPSYQSFLSSHQKKDSLKSLTEEASNVDDRPESDQHLNSLPRPHTAEFVRQEKPSHHHPLLHQPHHQMGMASYSRGQMPLQVGAVLETVPDQDPNKLTVGSGYNSDTESSPSRTLNRAGKLNEVSTPTKTTIPQRYRAASLHSSREQQSQQRAQQQQQPQQKSRPQHYQDMYLQSRTIGKSGSLPSSTTGTPSPPVPKSMTPHTDASISRRTLSANGRTEDAVVSLVADLDASTKATVMSRRPKSGDVTRIQEKFKRQSLERTSSNVEDAKIKLGLIPSPRQRSKSTSEKEAMKVIHKIIEEDEPATRVSQDEERAEKHKGWISSAPTSAERRKAWEHLTQQQFQRMDGRTRSFRNDQGTGGITVEKAPAILKPSITPELKRKSATMPDYLVTGSSRYAALRGGHVKTVKVTSYEVPEAKKVRKINLRTYH